MTLLDAGPTMLSWPEILIIAGLLVELAVALGCFVYLAVSN